MMRTSSSSILTRRDKIIMIAGGIALAAAFGGVAAFGVGSYIEGRNQDAHNEACAKDREHLRNGSNNNDSYVIPQGCYGP